MEKTSARGFAIARSATLLVPAAAITRQNIIDMKRINLTFFIINS
jgi:hypothetical protein